MKSALRFSLLFLVFAPLIAFAQPQPTVSEDGLVEIANAPGGTTTYDNAKKLGRITKDVVITQKKEDLIVYAQDVIYSRSQNQATATGQLRVLTRDSTIRGQKLFADFNARRFIISGDVVITSYGKSDGAMSGLRSETTKKSVRVWCDQVVWEYDIRQATATGNIKISQQATRGTCNSILYDEPSNVIQLEGSVRFGDDEERRLSSPRMIFYVDKDLVHSTDRTKLSFPPPKDAENSRPDKQSKVIEPAPELPADIDLTPTGPPSPGSAAPSTP